MTLAVLACGNGNSLRLAVVRAWEAGAVAIDEMFGAPIGVFVVDTL